MKARKLIHGWNPDLPDHRDLKYVPTVSRLMLPSKVDLSTHCPPVYDQGNLGSCTANAIAGAIEFDQIHNKLTVFVPSRLFIYFGERAMEHTTTIDSGAQIRDGVQFVHTKGAPPETSWPYVESQFAVQAPPAVWGEAFHHKTVLYTSIAQDAAHIKSCLASGFPVIFGFTVYEAFESEEVAKTGILNLPTPSEKVVGGHAVLIVGYDDHTQRFLVRNSWGPDWGHKGYFTMPYAYVTNPDLADDFWTIQSTK